MGSEADQVVVPAAVPEPPVEVVHCTDATPAVSLAVPLKVRFAEDVETIVELGEIIVRLGGTVSEPVVGLPVPLPVIGVPLPPLVPVPVVPVVPVLPLVPLPPLVPVPA